jgi:hypothetical protein
MNCSRLFSVLYDTTFRVGRVLKEDRQFDRFLTRGKPNVKTELLLLCFGYNVNKLHAKIQNERCGVSLHDLKTAA